LRACLYAGQPHFAKLDEIAPSEPFDAAQLAAGGLSCSSAPFVSSIADFYLTNPIARASAVMAECSALAEGFAREAAE
jgi:NADH-quinone oxidoreductase subunit G